MQLKQYAFETIHDYESDKEDLNVSLSTLMIEICDVISCQYLNIYQCLDV